MTAPETDDVLVRIDGVTRDFGDIRAVDNVSLDIRRGEFFSLLGGSGCGKTTLLRMLAGFETPSAGRIMIDGTDVASVPAYDRPVNMMFRSRPASAAGWSCRSRNRPAGKRTRPGGYPG